MRKGDILKLGVTRATLDAINLILTEMSIRENLSLFIQVYLL